MPHQGIQTSSFAVLVLCLFLCSHLVSAAPDSFEPNNSPTEAKTLTSGKPLSATLFPVGDQDFFQVPIATGLPLQLNITLEDVPPNISVHLLVQGGNLQELFSLGSPVAQPLQCSLNLAAPGSLTIRVIDGPKGIGEAGYSYDWNNAASSQPYRLTVNVTPMPDDHEPNNAPESPRDLPLNTDFTGRLFPVADQDWFRVTIPPGKRGLLKVSLYHPSDLIQSTILLRDSASQDLDFAQPRRGDLAEVNAEVASGVFLFRFMDGPTGKNEPGYSYEWGNQASRLEYKASVRFLEVPDPLEQVDQVIPATITLHTDIPGALFPRGDVDRFTFEIPAPGVGLFTADVDASLAPILPQLRLLNSKNEELAKSMGPEANLCRIQAHLAAPGWYSLELIDGAPGTGEAGYSYDFGNRTGPYTLRTSFSPISDSDDPHAAFEKALPVPQNVLVQSYLFPTGENEFFRISVPGSGTIPVEVSIPDLSAPVAPQLTLLDGTGGDARNFSAGLHQPLVARWSVAAPATQTFRIRDGGHGLREAGYSYDWNNQTTLLPYHVSWRVLPAPPIPLASPSIPLGEYQVATAARSIAFPASFSFFLYPKDDQEFLNLGECGPCLLEGIFEASDQVLDPVIQVLDVTASQTEPFAEVNNTPHAQEHFRLVLPRRGRWMLRVTSSGNASSSNPIHAQVMTHPFDDGKLASDGSCSTPQPVLVPDLNRGISNRIFPPRDQDTYLLNFAEKGMLQMSGVEPSGVGLKTIFQKHASTPFRVLYLVGGRRDYDIFGGHSANAEVVRLQEDSPKYLQSFRYMSASPYPEYPPPAGATLSVKLDVPLGLQFGRLVFRGHGFDTNPFKVRCNGQTLVGRKISEWNEWSEAVYEIASLSDSRALDIDLDATERGVLVADARFEAWTGTHTLSLPLPPFTADPLPASLTEGFDAIILDGLNHPYQFFLNRPIVQKRLEALASEGKRLVVVCPQSFSYSLAARQAGGWVATCSSELTSSEALIDGTYDPNGGNGAKLNGTPPGFVVFGLPGSWPTLINRVGIHTTSPEAGQQLRTVRLEASLESSTSGFQNLGEFSVEPGQRFLNCRFAAVAARFVRVTILASERNQGTWIGDCEIYGPESVNGFFGVSQQFNWRNDTVQAVSIRDELVSGQAQGNPNGWPASDLSGCWVGWSESGFTPSFVDAADPRQLGVTIYRRTGKGMIVLDTQEIGYSSNLGASSWKTCNLLNIPFSPQQTLGAKGYFNVSGSGTYLFSVHPADAEVWASAPYSFSFTFLPASSTFEPNDTPETAFSIGSSVTETSYPFFDQDWWQFSVATPSRLLFHLDNLSRTLDPILSVGAQGTPDKNLLELQGSCRQTFGAGETGSLIATMPGLYFAGVKDGFPPNRSRLGYRLSTFLKPINQAFEPNDTTFSATQIEDNRPLRAAIFPDQDQDWYVLDMASGPLDLQLTCEAEDLDPQIRIFHPFESRNGMIPVLYLVGGLKDYHTLEQHLADPFRVTRVNFNAPQATNIWKRLSEFQIVVVDGLTEPGQFDIFNPEVQDRIVQFVRSGGRFLLTAPSFSFSELRQSIGGKVVSQTGFWDGNWLPANLIDGFSLTGNGSFFGTHGWCCARGGATFPQEIVFSFPPGTGATIDRVILRATAQQPARNVRDFELFLSDREQPEAFERLGSYTARQLNEPQVFSFSSRPATYLKLVIHSNWGDQSEVQLGEIEALGSSSEKLLFGMKPVQFWEKNQVVVPATPGVGLPYHEKGQLTGFPWHDSTGWLEGWKEAGFEAMYVHASATQTRAISVFKRLGSGTLAIDMQNLGGRDQNGLRWKMFNLCDLPVPLLHTINGTCGGGWGAPERHIVHLPEGRYLLQISAADHQGSPDSYSLSARFAPTAAHLPLRISGIEPSSGLMGLNPDCRIRLTFNQPVTPQSLQPGSIRIDGDKSGTITWTPQFLPGENALVLEFSPEFRFADNENVTITCSPGCIKSGQGQSLQEPFLSSFRIGRTIRSEARLSLVWNKTGMIGLGGHSFSVTSSQPLKHPPTVTLTQADGRRIPLALTSAGSLSWQGELSITSSMPQGRSTLSVSGVSVKGDPVPSPAPVPFTIDTVPPSTPDAPPTARPVAGGQVELSWALPSAREEVVGFILGRNLAGNPPQDVARLEQARVLSHLDATPAEGLWEYRLSWLDAAGNRSPWSKPVIVDTDRTSPVQPPASVSFRLSGSRISLNWKPVSDKDVVGYNLYRVPTGQEFTRSRFTPVQTTDHGATAVEDVPGDGDWTYHVAARDRAGNIGPAAPCRVILDTVPARGNLIITNIIPHAPVTATQSLYDRVPPGTITIIATLTEPLSSLSSFSVRLADRTIIHGEILNATSTTFSGRVVLTASAADGPFTFQATARDRAGNVGLALHHPGYFFDTASPSWQLSWTPERATLIGTVTLYLTPSEPVLSTPTVFFTLASQAFSIAPLARRPDGIWTGSFHLASQPADGEAIFTVQGIDLFGRSGSLIRAGMTFYKDSTSPEAPLSLRTAAGNNGGIKLTWKTPVNEVPWYYSIYRASGTEVLQTPESRIATIVHGLEYVDPSASGTACSYRVSATDKAGNEGLACAAIQGVSDVTPPPPPDEVRAQILPGGQVRIQWKKPRLEEVARYRIVREYQLRSGKAGSEKIFEDRPTEFHDLPALSGEVAYTVSSLDEAGNESPVVRTATLSYDLTPPTVKGIFTPSFGRRMIPVYGLMSVSWKDLGEVVKPGPLDIVLQFDEPIRDLPKLTWRTSINEVPQTVSLTRKSDSWFSGRVELSAHPGQDLDIRFALEAHDPAGNRSADLGAEAHLLLDSNPPVPINQFTVVPGPQGTVSCSWAAPGSEPEGEPVYQLFRSDRPFSSSDQATCVAPDLKTTTTADRPPRDGTWYYSVAARDRAGFLGSLTPALMVESDSVPPLAPEALTMRIGREVELSWSPAIGSDTRYWQAYIASVPIVDASSIAGLKPASDRLTQPRFSFTPQAWPVIHVGIAAFDAAGNRSLTPLVPSLKLADKIPAARIRIEPPGPARGAVRLLLETSLPVRALPSLWFEPAHHSPISLTLASDSTAPTRFSASLPVDEKTGDGTGTFRFLGYSSDGMAGTEVVEGKHLVVDTTPPTLRIEFQPPAPLRTGRLRVRVAPSEPLAETPSLSLVPQGGSPIAITLAAASEGVFVGEFTLPEALPDGLAFLKASARDQAGNTGTGVVPDRVFIDTHPPRPPVGLRAVSRTHGAVELVWLPPETPPGQPRDAIREYVLYRHHQPLTTASTTLEVGRTRSQSWFDSAPPSDGRWFYAVTAVDEAGWQSPLSSSTTAISDRTPPPAPPAPSVSVSEDQILLRWSAAPTTGSETVRFDVLCESPDPASGRPVFEQVFNPGTSTSCTHRPLRGGDLKYVVRATDALGHQSAYSPSTMVHFERLAPAAQLQFSPPAPWATGTVSLQLESSRPLSSPPVLSWLPIYNTGSQTASLSSQILKGSGTNWKGSFSVPTQEGIREIIFSWKGTAVVSGKSVTGTDFLTPCRVSLDRLGPEGRIRFSDATPRKDRQAILKAGRFPLTLQLTESTARLPQLAFEAQGGKRISLPLTPAGENRFEGVLIVDEKTGDGAGHFFLQAVDPAGNPGTSIAEGGTVLIDTVTPARVGKIRAVSYPGGKVRIDWSAPLTSAGRADPSANRFHLYRSSQEILDIRGLTPIQTISRYLGAFDEPKGSRKCYYAIVAIDEAGNEGPLSLCAMTNIDNEAPPPPRAISARIMENGVIKVTWEPPPGEQPAMYNVYLEKFPVLSVAGLTPNAKGVPFTYLYGTPNDDGRYYFAVTAIDGSLNESQPSETVSVDYARTLPLASFTVLPDIWLKNGVFDVCLDTSKPLIEPPVVEIRHEKGLSFPLRFSGVESRWTARLTIDDTLPEGTCGFLFTGKGAGNTVGREITRGPLFHIDRTAPFPPSNLRIQPDDANTPGAVRLTWNSPKKTTQATEVPHFYRLYRSSRPMTSIKGLTPVHEYRVQYQNLDEYIYHDIPPIDGTWHYVVTSVDLAGNESVPSADSEVVSSTKVPRLVVKLFTPQSGETPTDRIGSGTSLVEVSSSQPLASLTLQWYEISRAEKLEGALATRTPILMEPRIENGATASSRVWRGSVIIDRPSAVEIEAAFEARAVSIENQTGSFISSGKSFFVDTVGPEARIRIPSVRQMRIDAQANTLVVAPVTGGQIEVQVETLGELFQPPELAWAFEESEDWHPITVSGFGTQWSGVMLIPDGIASTAARFRYRGVDRIGNVSTIIEPRTYERKLDEDSDPPRTLESYATTGGRFTIDSIPPEPPRNLRLDQKQLGISVIKWDEGPGEPKSFNLYRSLTPITDRLTLTPIKTGIFAPIIVDDPPVDGNFFYAVTQLDMAGNESPVSESKSVFIDSIKPELKIRAVPSGEDFIILADEEEEQTLSVELRFPGGKTMQVELGGSSGELQEISVPGENRKRRGKVLPQLLKQFNGTVEIIVHSPDPVGNRVEQITTIETKQIPVETGGDIQSADQKVSLEVPAGMVPVIPKGPGEFQRVGGFQNLFFIRHENIPSTAVVSTASAPANPKDPDPLPPSLEVVGTPYRIELNVNTEKPMELKASASQADFGKLKELTAKLRMKIPDMGSEAIADQNYLATRLKVVKWVPATRDEADGKIRTDKRGRWEIVPDIEISTSTREIIAPARDITTYVIVSERTPPSIVDLEPAPDSTVKTFKPTIKARLIDKGTGIAQGAENRIILHIDGMPADPARLTVSTEDPTEVTVSYQPSEDLTPGTHIITIKAQDVVENQSVRRWKFIIDNEPPRISSILPAEKAIIGLSRPVISAVTEDEGGGIDPERTALLLDGASLTPKFDPVSGRLVAFPDRPLTSGSHQVQLLFEDRGGKKVSKTWSFGTDTEAPLVRLVQPASAAPLIHGKLPLIIGVADNGTGVDPASILLDLDGRLIGPAKLFDVSDTFSYDPVRGELTIALATGLKPGPHQLLLSAGDHLGRFRQEKLPFTVDAGPPTLTFEKTVPGKSGANGHLLRIREDQPNPRIESSVPWRFDPRSGLLLLIPEPGTAQVTLTVLDAAGFTATSRFNPASGEITTTTQSPISRHRAWYPWLFLLAGLIATGWMWLRKHSHPKPS